MSTPTNLIIRPITPADRDYLRRELTHHWSSATIRSVDIPYQADELAGFIAELAGKPVGQITIAFEAARCEIITLSAGNEGNGIGTALIKAAADVCRERGYTRVTLTTTNDNLRALAFYQKRGWRLVAVHVGMIDRYRKLEPKHPTIGLNGIPLHDEIELALDL